MASTDALLASLNAGEISRHALARIDLQKLRVACERQSNFLPNVLGPTMVRPGTRHLASTAGNAAGWLGEFYFDESTKALLVLTSGAMQVMVNDAYVSRVAVSSAVTNGNFNTDIASWTDSDEAGGASTWHAGGAAQFIGTGTNYAWLDQEITVIAADQNKEHALRLVVDHGYVAIKVGTTQGTGAYWELDDLPPGTYSLAFTPPGNFWIRIGARTTYSSLVNSINVESAGTLSLPTPWTTTAHFDTLRYDQSGDVLFCACAGIQQRRIERRASDSRSWAVALYQSDDGPFRLGNTSDSIQITPTGTSGSVGLTANRDLWKSTSVGSLYRITHPSQTVTAALAVLNAATGSIRVSGLAAKGFSSSSRSFTVIVEGTFVATVTLQRSIGAPGSWTNVESYTAPTSKTFDDGLDNQIIYYRLIATAYTSGTANATLIYNSSSQTGIVRIGTFTNAQSVTADVLVELGGTTATSDWAEGEWSDRRGWPAAVVFHDGRLAWFPSIKAQLSVSDGFSSFDDTIEGDAGPINRTIATGGNDGIRWGLSLEQLIVGTAGQEVAIRASSLDEPLTPTAFAARACSTRGAAKVRAIKVDTTGIFVERNGKRIFELALQAGDFRYRSRELTRLKQEMCDAGVRDVAVQRQPDTRLWFVLGDGTCAVLTYDLEDDVVAWTPVTTDGSFERVAVLPGTDEDDVYFIVNRSVGGTKRYVEKLAKRSECVGGTLSKACIDSHIVYTGAAVTTITGLSHLEGKQVVVWGDGKPQVTADAPKTVTAGQITGLPVAVSNAVAGLSATAQLKTAQLAYGAEHGTAAMQVKRASLVGLDMLNVCLEGVKVGRDFAHLQRLATTYKGRALTPGEVVPSFNARPSCFNGGWDSDARICVEIKGPYPATIKAIATLIETNEAADKNEPRVHNIGSEQGGR